MPSHLLSRYFDPVDATPRDGAVWLVLAAVALSLLLGFWAVCSSQVRKAESRQATVPEAGLEQCDPSFALPAMGHCPSARTLIGTR
ncbi:hypothetical protein [Ramlibacter algicola]|uniref:Uncharacterized protein n=1 Tax=Ramlibacter algicola TaxID=2795217 RepID=A0A934UTK0_9BURK|nr:hypothetical protein [Ramlibacter algicola]MBK0394612.1 hypothetical protein [Ramlibacter algicola]